MVKPVLPEILRAKAGVYLQLQERTQRLLRQSRQLRDVHQRLDVAEHEAREREAALATARRLEKLQEVLS